MSEARNHHYVPQGYLRFFGDRAGRKARVFVTDLERRKQFTTLVRNIGASRDFNRIETDLHEPNALEKAYGEFETQATEAIRRIDSSKTLSSTEDFIVVLNLIALLAIRNPRVRSSYSDFMENIWKRSAELIVHSRERWEATEKKMREAGYTNSADISYEEMKDFVQRGEYDVETSTTAHASMELKQLTFMTDLLAKRKWKLLVSSSNTGDFITSDHPVCLIPTRPELSGRPLGYGLKHTMVIFPLTRSLLMIGDWGGSEGEFKVTGFNVAAYNGCIIRCCGKQVYGPSEAFHYYTSNGGLRRGSELLTDPEFAPSAHVA